MARKINRLTNSRITIDCNNLLVMNVVTLDSFVTLEEGNYLNNLALLILAAIF